MRFVLASLTLASLVAAQPPPGPISSTATTGATGVLSPPLSPRNANYAIDARLDPATRTVTASQVILWRNTTTRSTDELQLNLYWNAWRNDRSTWLREEA